MLYSFFFGNKYLKYRHRDDISFPRGGKNKWKNDIRASSYLERVIPGRKQQCLLPGYFFRIFFFLFNPPRSLELLKIRLLLSLYPPAPSLAHYLFVINFNLPLPLSSRLNLNETRFSFIIGRWNVSTNLVGGKGVVIIARVMEH